MLLSKQMCSVVVSSLQIRVIIENVGLESSCPRMPTDSLLVGFEPGTFFFVSETQYTQHTEHPGRTEGHHTQRFPLCLPVEESYFDPSCNKL